MGGLGGHGANLGGGETTIVIEQGRKRSYDHGRNANMAGLLTKCTLCTNIWSILLSNGNGNKYRHSLKKKSTKQTDPPPQKKTTTKDEQSLSSSSVRYKMASKYVMCSGD